MTSCVTSKRGSSSDAKLPCVGLLFTFSDQTTRRLAEVGFLLVTFAGVWLAAAHTPQLKFATGRTIVAGVALAIGGLLLIVATHWGRFG